VLYWVHFAIILIPVLIESPIENNTNTPFCGLLKVYFYVIFVEVRRGCRLPGAGPPGSSYAEYLCDHSFCNHASSVLVSTKTLFTMMTSAILYLYMSLENKLYIECVMLPRQSVYDE